MKSLLGGALFGAASITFCIATSRADAPSGTVDVAKLQQFKKSCKGLPTTITRDQIKTAFQRKLFPGPLDNMGEFLDRIERDLNHKSAAESCSPLSSTESMPSHPLFRESKVPPIFKDVVRGATDLLLKDMKSQQDFARDGLHCAEKLDSFLPRATPASGAPNAVQTMTPEQIAAYKRTTKTPDECGEFVTEYIPDLQDRFESMRTFLAIGTDQVNSASIKPDRSALSRLTALYFPTVGRKEAAQTLAPLSEKMRSSLSDLSSVDAAAKEAARKKSFKVLSTAPILALFSDTPDAKTISSAFQILNRQMAEDIKDIEKNVPQEITLLLPYVMQSLAQMPIEKRGDACLIFQELHENMVKRYIKVPFWETMVGFSFAGVGGLTAMSFARSGTVVKTVGQNLSQFVKGFSPAATAAMVGAGASTASNGLRDYFFRTKLCSVTADAADATKRVSSLCDFGAAEEGLRETQNSAITQVVMGATIFGVGRFLK